MTKKRIAIIMVTLLSLSVYSKTITINMKDAVLSSGYPNVVEIEGKFYVLDKKQRKVFVFDDKKFLFYFAQAGQGPGDLENPVAIAANGEKVYIMETWSGKISIFSKQGKFLQTFKLKESSQRVLSLLCDLDVYDNKLVVSITRGREFLRFYDFRGKLLHVVLKEKEEFKQLGHSYDLDIDRKNKRAYVLSRFTGETIIVSLRTLKVINKLEIGDPVVDKLVKPIIKKDKEYKVQKDSLSIHEYLGFFPLIRDNDKLVIICSSDKVKKDGGFRCYTFFTRISPELTYIKFGVEDVWYLKKFNQYYLLIDKEGNIFLKRRL